MSNARNIASGAKFVDTAGDSMTGNLTTTGNVGVGEASPNLGSSGTGLHIKGAASKLGIIKLDSQTANYSGRVQFTENGTDKWRIGYDATSNHLEFTRSGVADRMLISDDGYVTISNQPFFSCKLNTQTPTSGGGVVKLSSWVSLGSQGSLGSHFANNSKFTAPVAGRYLFCYNGLHNIGGNSAGYSRAYTYVNGVLAVDGLGDQDSEGSYMRLAYSVILNLSANDYVEIYCNALDSNAFVYDHYTTWSGMLMG